MKERMITTTARLILTILTSSFALMMFSPAVFATGVFRKAAGANPAAIQATVDLFRSDLGGVNNGVGNSFTTGRREINWDAVPDANASPNNLPLDFFNVNSPRGVVLDGSTGNFMRVSATAASGTAVRFGEIDASYTNTFQAFSAERLFTAFSTGPTSDEPNIIDIVFFIPGTKIPATVSGFGVVFTDVDFTGSAVVICFGTDGRRIAASGADPADGGLSFVGISFNAGERVAHVRILCGKKILSQGNTDTASRDIVAMDDFIYGEPRAEQYHPSDFDGDGTTDLSVFRPSNGTWFVLNSGNSSFSFTPFGQNGDIPVEGDFDGDARSDIAVFRPTVGTWFILRSSDGQFASTQFGQNGDRPVPGDYDKDGKTDISLFRPATGQWFTLRSSNGAFQATQWGQNLDIPIPASAQ